MGLIFFFGAFDFHFTVTLVINTSDMHVSVVIPTFNRMKYLKRAVRSVIAQTYRDWDIWIVDDGSTDQTPFWALNELPFRNINYVRTKNLGVSHARNLGIQLSKGPWIAFLDSDDEWLEHKLKEQMRFAKENPVKIIHSEEIWVRNGVRVNPHKKHQKSGGRIFKNSVDLCCMSPSAIAIHRDLFLSEGLFREDFPVCEDYDLWLRLTSKFDVGFIEQPLIKKYAGHKGQLSHQYFAMDYWRIQSLIALKDSPNLNREENQHLKESLKKRAGILLKGYKKHNNMTHYKEVEWMLNQL